MTEHALDDLPITDWPAIVDTLDDAIDLADVAPDYRAAWLVGDTSVIAWFHDVDGDYLHAVVDGVRVLTIDLGLRRT